jgi:hypothetical protein
MIAEDTFGALAKEGEGYMQRLAEEARGEEIEE